MKWLSPPKSDPSYGISRIATIAPTLEDSSSCCQGSPMPSHLMNLDLMLSEDSSCSNAHYIPRANLTRSIIIMMEEYFEMGHAEPVPLADLEKLEQETFYLPMHAVRKESSSTTKIRVVFDASAKSSASVSLNDTLLVGPTVHSPLIDVLLQFRFHRVALTTNVSRMYRAV